MGTGTGVIGFAGRAAEAERFVAFVRAHAQRVRAGSAAYGPRCNVLVFRGQGGIGKSELLARLRGWVESEGALEDWGHHGLTGFAPIAVHYDLSDHRHPDELLHALRRRAGEVVQTPAFDLGLLTLWSLRRLDQAPDLSPKRQIGPIDLWPSVESVGKSLLSELGFRFGTAGLTVDVVKKVIAAVREPRRRRQLMDDYEPLAEAMEHLLRQADAFGGSRLARVFNRELDRVPAASRRTWIVFLDTFEAVQGDTRFHEGALNRMVYDTPNVCWVIAGRRPLTWAAARGGAYPYAGPARWAGLAEAEQPVLGPLGDDEVRRLAVAALPDGGEARATTIAEATRGFPLAVALAIGTTADLLAAGATVDAAAVGSSFDGIVGRLTDDLTSESRRALNAASLVSAFDADLLSAGAGIRRTDAKGFLREPVVAEAHGPPLPYSLHPVLREAVRLAGTWDEEDWCEAGRAMLDGLRHRHEDATDVDARLAFAGAAFDISAELGLEVPWLLAAAVGATNKDRLIAAVEGRRPERSTAPWPRAFERLVTAWAPLAAADRAAAFAALARDPETPDDLARTAARQRAYQLRTAGRHAKAARIFADLREGHEDDALLTYQLALSLIHLGRFREADALRRRLEDVEEPTDETRSHASRLDGELRLQYGDLRAAAAASAARAKYFGAANDHWNALEVSAAEARQLALLDGPEALAVVESIVAAADAGGAPRLLRSALCSRAICLAGTPDARSAIDAALEVGRAAGDGAPTYHEAVACTFDAAVRGDSRTMQRVRDWMAGVRRTRDSRWCRPVCWWQDITFGLEPRRFDRVDWIEPQEVAMEAWTGLVAARARAARA